MELIVFDISGRMAHFRKFYTNSSSLSYSIPPRTTLCGIIAAILGFERDSYYEMLSSTHLHIALRKLGKTKRLMQSLNYIKAANASEIYPPKEHTQIPFEIVTSEGNVSYRVYVHHDNNEIMRELEKRIRERRYVYPPYFGAAPFSCNVEYVGSFNAEEASSMDYTDIATVIRQDYIEKNGIGVGSREASFIKERMPRDFYEGRRLKQAQAYIYEESGLPLKIRVKGTYYTVNNEEKENILFL